MHTPPQLSNYATTVFKNLTMDLAQSLPEGFIFF